jgi:hypothetical protein
VYYKTRNNLRTGASSALAIDATLFRDRKPTYINPYKFPGFNLISDNNIAETLNDDVTIDCDISTVHRLCRYDRTDVQDNQAQPCSGRTHTMPDHRSKE